MRTEKKMGPRERRENLIAIYLDNAATLGKSKALVFRNVALMTDHQVAVNLNILTSRRAK